ncbi:hypothetical protein BJ085DRAFT_31147 [Dimargaris cristalligena]|uniref:Uncharacterized protein n=1 Tax=Dimargaris cristalligena TaxID=215637 RepID=A0A4P9ZTW1_9FUNG|nr:hypothetical protein BJ085DRAFT_31147 [Dimargaris cristalligena]|eukprot:RKP36291.1 hypothetical protein BJ085DRAFT_31147 [Dimargaris cristalligena]
MRAHKTTGLLWLGLLTVARATEPNPSEVNPENAIFYTPSYLYNFDEPTSNTALGPHPIDSLLDDNYNYVSQPDASDLQLFNYPFEPSVDGSSAPSFQELSSPYRAQNPGGVSGYFASLPNTAGSVYNAPDGNDYRVNVDLDPCFLNNLVDMAWDPTALSLGASDGSPPNQPTKKTLEDGPETRLRTLPSPFGLAPSDDQAKLQNVERTFPYENHERSYVSQTKLDEYFLSIARAKSHVCNILRWMTIWEYTPGLGLTLVDYVSRNLGGVASTTCQLDLRMPRYRFTLATSAKYHSAPVMNSWTI